MSHKERRLERQPLPRPLSELTVTDQREVMGEGRNHRHSVQLG